MGGEAKHKSLQPNCPNCQLHSMKKKIESFNHPPDAVWLAMPKQDSPQFALDLLPLSGSLSLGPLLFLSYHSHHLRGPSSSSSPSLSFWANLKSKRQRPLSVTSVHSQCQPQCPGCLYLPARHTPSTHQSTVGRASLSPIHGVIYTLDAFS